MHGNQVKPCHLLLLLPHVSADVSELPPIYTAGLCLCNSCDVYTWCPFDPSGGLLDEFKCHMQGSFIRRINDLGTEVDFIPGGYTCLLQPCDVGVNKPLKQRIVDQYMGWAIEKYKDLGRDDKLKAPSRKEITIWNTYIVSSIYTLISNRKTLCSNPKTMKISKL